MSRNLPPPARGRVGEGGTPGLTLEHPVGGESPPTQPSPARGEGSKGRWLWIDLYLVAVLLVTAVAFRLSLEWPMQHDTPLLHYATWLMDTFGRIPYRDVFETSMPGTFAFHLAIGTLLGWGDTAFRAVDVGSMVLAVVVTAGLMRPFGLRAVLGGSLLFILSYLWLGPVMSLQRDYVGTILVAGAAALAGSARVGPVRLVAIGLLFGLAATIKPHLAVGLGPVTWYLLWRRHHDHGESWRQAAVASLPMLAAATALPGVVALGVLVWLGAWPAFAELVFNYLPLHLMMTNDHQPIQGMRRVVYLIGNTLSMRGLWIGVPAAVCGGLLAWRATAPGSEMRARLILLLALAGVYLLYPAMAGQFFFYHWAPFQYFLALLAALVFLPTAPLWNSPRRWGVGFMVLALLAIHLRPNQKMLDQILTGQPPSPTEGNVELMEAALRKVWRPGDLVQPLDWTGGGIHAMFRVGAPLATRYMYDYHFYHHISEPEIWRLRADFMQQLTAAAPRFVLDVKDKPVITGPNSTSEFPELQEYLWTNYYPVAESRIFRLLERR